MRPLFGELFVDDISICAYGFRDGIVERFRKPAELKGKCGKEFLSVASVALATSEEEACHKALLVKQPSGNRSGNGGFTSASEAFQPKDKLVLTSPTPIFNFFKEIDSSILMALRLVFQAAVIKSGSDVW